MNTADGGAGVGVGRGRHGTRVQYHDLGVSRPRGARKSVLQKLLLNGGAVRLRGATAEIFQKIRAHNGVL